MRSKIMDDASTCIHMFICVHVYIHVCTRASHERRVKVCVYIYIYSIRNVQIVIYIYIHIYSNIWGLSKTSS